MPEFTLNKGIGKPIEFRGLKGKYAYYLVGGVVGLFILFILLYVVGIPVFYLLPVILSGGVGLFVWVYHMNKTYGQWGLLKRNIQRKQPPFVVCNRGRFIQKLAQQRIL